VGLVAVGLLAGCGGGGGSSNSLTVQPARQYRLVTQTTGTPTAGKPAHLSFRIVQPDGKTLTAYRRGSGPHTGVHLIFVRRDLGEIVHRHPAIAADGTFTDDVDFPTGGPYRLIVDAYPAQTTPQPNFQLFSNVHVAGAYKPQPLPPPAQKATVDGYTFALSGHPRLKAIEPAFLTFSVTTPYGTGAKFTPWYGALAHAIFLRKGTLTYFHTHVCAPNATGCTSTLGTAKVTGTSAGPGTLSVGVLVPVPGTWRLFLQSKVGGRVLTAPFTLVVR
jgi:hypothetical protein